MRTGNTDIQQRRELSGDEIEDPDEPPAPKRVKVTDETIEVPVAFYAQMVGMLEGFGTKSTVWYDSPESEKKRDKTAFVLWKGRTKPDGTMTLSVMDTDRNVREVVATEVSIAQQFKNIFDSNSASRIFVKNASDGNGFPPLSFSSDRMYSAILLSASPFSFKSAMTLD